MKACTAVQIASFVFLLGSGCAAATRTGDRHEKATAELGYRLASKVAAAASNLDVDAITPMIPLTDRVVYVSNGHPVRGTEYRAIMGAFYGSLQRLDWTWEKWEAFPTSDDSVVFTGWANVVAVRRDGERQVERAIHTMLFVREKDGWKRVISHKTNLPADERR
jgi:hypothetical protein